MKKTLIALAVLGACTGAAHAQTNVTIYGLVDTGLIKESGSDVRMGGNEDSRIGFKGTEDLGSGLKATFQLERRFNLNNGTRIAGNNALDKLQGADNGEDGVDWQGAANVGLSSDTWGALRLGRVNDIAIENFGALDPFIYYGVGSSFGAYNLLYSEELANTVRYGSPAWAGFSLNLSYTLGNDTHHGNGEGIYGNDTGGYDDYGNDGFGIGLKYDNGPLMLTANYERIADSDNSRLWDIGGAWTWQGFKVSVGYQDTTVERAAARALGIADMNIDQKDWLVGLQYNTGPNTVKFSYNRGVVESHGDYDGKANKYSLGYTYDMSKRTSLYAMVAYTDSDNDFVGEIYNSNHVADDSVTGVQLGIAHRF